MKKLEDITLKNVQEVYDGPEGVLWELIMGEQIHVGGFASSMTLAQKAGIKEGMHGLDLCSALGAGCRPHFTPLFAPGEGILGVAAKTGGSRASAKGSSSVSRCPHPFRRGPKKA